MKSLLETLIYSLGAEAVLFMAVIGGIISSIITLWCLLELVTRHYNARLRLADTRKLIHWTYKRAIK